jgi:uncharacterized membrane protein YedE/YeeE
MVFEDFSAAQHTILWATFGAALVMGAVVNKTNFCTMGAVSDLVNIGDSGRMRAWLLAATVAVIGVLVLDYLHVIDLGATRPPYRTNSFAWIEYALGGVMFGVGMTLASGCGNKCLIRIGGGNLKSVMVFLVVAVIAYYMINPFPGTDQTIYSILFYPWTNPLAVSLRTNQDLGSIAAGWFGGNGATWRLIVGGTIVVVALGLIFKSREFRGNFDNILGGVVVGLAVVGAWYVTSGLVRLQGMQDTYSWTSYVANWDFLSDGSTAAPRSVGVQSFTFINPMGETLGYAMSGFKGPFLTFGVVAVAGVVAGSLLWALISRGFRIEWFASIGDFVKHLVGAVLMGVGGVLAVGCTIGQAVTGVSTLALGSFIAFAGFVFGSALTMKIQFYKMVYEDAGLSDVIVTSLVDMRVLPKGLRKLEAV